MDPLVYDVFISYARRDDAGGWVSALQNAIYEDFKSFFDRAVSDLFRPLRDSQSRRLGAAAAPGPAILAGVAGVFVAELFA